MTKRIIIMAILLAVLLLGGNGCMKKNSVENSPEENNQKNINDVALAYMEQRYGGDFEYDVPWGNSLSGTHELLVKCDSLPDQQILVQIENYKQEKKIFRDNYLAVKYQAESIEFFHNCATEVFGEANIYYEIAMDGLSPELPADATLTEFLADTRVPLVIMVEVKASDFSSEEQAEKVAELIAENGTYFYLTVVIVDDSVYGTLNRKSLNERIALRQFVHCANITKIDETIQTEWLGRE